MKKYLFLMLFNTICFSVFAQKTGINERDPESMLSVKGELSVGKDSSYTRELAPLGGAIIQGTVGIGTNAPDSSAILELNATDKGILVPRVSTTQRNSISNPANGLLLYDTNESKFYYYADTLWKPIEGNSNTGQLFPSGALMFGAGSGTTSDSSNLFWNNTSKRLGIRTTSPRASLQVNGAGSDSTTSSLEIHNSTGVNNALVVKDDGFIGFGINTKHFITSAGTNVIRANTSSVNYLSLFSNGGVFLGSGATGTSTGTAGLGYRGIAIGFESVANTAGNQGVDQQGIAIGQSAKAYGGSIVLGSGSTGGWSVAPNNANRNIVIGHNVNTVNGYDNIAIGSSASACQNVVVIGRNINAGSINYNNTGQHVLIGHNIGLTTALNRNSIIALGSGAGTLITIPNSFQIYLAGQAERSFFINSNSNVVLRNNEQLIPGTQFDNNATNTFTIHNGTAPTGNLVDAVQLFSRDRIAGQAGLGIRSENGTQHIFSDRVGIRTITPGASLTVVGAGTTDTTFSLQVHNSTGTNNALVVRDDGNIGLGTNAPSEKLHISGTGSQRIRLTGSGGDLQLYSQSSNNRGILLGNNLILRNLGGGSLNTLEVLGISTGTYDTRFLVSGSGSGQGSVEITTRTGGNNGVVLDMKRAGITEIYLASNGGIDSYINTTRSFIFGGSERSSASAIVEMISTTQGILPPRMTTTQRDAITSPAEGLVIFNSTTKKHQGFDGTQWNDFY